MKVGRMKEKTKRNFWVRLLALSILVAGILFYFTKTTSMRALQEPQKSTKKTSVSEVPRNILIHSAEKNAIMGQSGKSKKILHDDVVSNIRSQLKMNLAALYTGEISFKADYGRYSTDLIFIGWTPEREKMNYKMGFLAEHWPRDIAVMDGQQEDPSRMNTDFFVNQFLNDSKTPATYINFASSINLEDYRRFCENSCSAYKNSFEIIIVAKFENDQEDVWIINQDKNLIHVKDGITGKELRKHNRK